MAPVRVWLRRTKGWRMPANTVKVTRGKGNAGRWGNPFYVVSEGKAIHTVFFDGLRLDHYDSRSAAIEAAVSRFSDWVIDPFEINIKRDELVAELRGKNLACWCPLDRPCHADVLLDLANR